MPRQRWKRKDLHTVETLGRQAQHHLLHGASALARVRVRAREQAGQTAGPARPWRPLAGPWTRCRACPRSSMPDSPAEASRRVSGSLPAGAGPFHHAERRAPALPVRLLYQDPNPRLKCPFLLDYCRTAPASCPQSCPLFSALYPQATRCLCLQYPLASMIPVGSTTRGEKEAQFQCVSRGLRCRYSAGDSIRHPRRTPALPADSPHAMPVPSSRQAGRQAGMPSGGSGRPVEGFACPPPCAGASGMDVGAGRRWRPLWGHMYPCAPLWICCS